MGTRRVRRTRAHDPGHIPDLRLERGESFWRDAPLATHWVVGAKHLPRYLGAFAWRFNRRLS